MKKTSRTAIVATAGVTVAAFLVTEFALPEAMVGPNWLGQRLVWSVVATLATLIVAHFLSILLDIQGAVHERLDTFRDQLDRFRNKEIQVEFDALFTAYYQHFTIPRFIIHEWAQLALTQLRQDMVRGGYISLPRERQLLQREFAKVYGRAREHIIAVNVGSTRFYFENSKYVISNQAAAERHVAVVRFYLYRKNIEMRDLTQASTLDVFRQEVKELHDLLLSVCSIIIDVSTSKLSDHCDYLMVDNKFVAQTVLTPNWEFMRARASEEDIALKLAREYFDELQGAMKPDDKENVFWMSAENMVKCHPDHAKGKAGQPDRFSRDLFESVMSEITGTSRRRPPLALLD